MCKKREISSTCIGLNVIACMYAYIDVYTRLYNVFKDIMNRTELHISRYTSDCIILQSTFHFLFSHLNL